MLATVNLSWLGDLFPFGLILVYGVAFLAVYWVIRLAVRHAIQDADKRRSSTRS